MRDLERLKTIQAVVDRELRPGRAAERLGLTVRQVERLVIRYRAEGPVGLISRHRHRSGNRALKNAVAEQILEIVRDQYLDFGPTLAAEKLAERHQIVLAKETVRRIQIQAGLWIPRNVSSSDIRMNTHQDAMPLTSRCLSFMMPAMRTTLTLDDDVAERLQVESQRTGRSFKEVVNEHLRISLARSRALKSMSQFRVTPANLGGPATVGSYDDVAALLEESEGVDHR
jgi:transposase